MVIVGSVSYLSGGAVALGADGTERVLFVGDQIYAGDVVRVAQDAEIEISMDIGESIRLDSGQSWLVSNETYMSAKDLDLSESSALAESIRASTLAGQDPTDIYEAPAAGGESDTGDIQDNQGSSIVTISRTAEEVDPTAGYETIGYTQVEATLPEEELVSLVQSVSIDRVDANGNLTTRNVIEGEDIIFRFKVNVVSDSDLVLETTIGTVTIPAGQTYVDVTVSSREDDWHIQGPETITASVIGVQGEGADIDFPDTGTSATVVDDFDTTTVTLSDVTANEGDGTATINASVDNPPQTDLVLTLSTGDTLTILAGETTGSVDVAINNDDDVYLDGSSFDVSVTGSTGGNFEDLDTSDTATVTVDDTLDTTTVTLSDVTANEGDGTATITASVDNPPQTDLVLTLSTGDTLTILAGETTGSVDVAINNDDDVYLDGSSFDVSVTGSTGGNFEDLDTSDTATVTVQDTNDTTTVTLSDVTANEGDGTATITASVDNPPQTDLVLTLSTGDTLTILAGETTGSVDVAINNGDDVYLDGSSFDVSVTGSTGGNFEDLDTSDTATVTVDDTLDTTTVTLSDVTANEGDGTASITATVDNPPQTDLVLTLSTGDTLTILAGETTGSVDVAINNDDDVYLDGSSFDVSVTGSTGGNFEDLDTSDTATVTVQDTNDTTTVTLSDVTANEGDGTATITASVDNPPQTDLVLTLSTGDTLTILAGETTGSVDVAINNDDDVYLDGSSFDVSVTGSSGGNFEDLDTSDTATVTVDDTLDTTTVTLSDVTANEGDGTATITASVDNPPQTDLVLTLSTGDTLTILAGETTGSVDVAINNDDDVYLDGSSFDVSVTGSTGGNFEDLDTSDTATVTVQDTNDTTTVTLSDVTANEGDGTATITASVDNPPQTDLVLTLSTGDTLTILAGETTGSVDVAINNDDDVYLDGSSFDVSVTGSSGGNFEDLDTSDTATVTVQDTNDTTTVTLSDVTANEGDGTATITASVDNPPQTDLVLTLSTGDTLTILAGETTGSVDVAINNDDDVYVDGSSFDVSVTGSSGGNFEDLDTSDTATVTVQDTNDTTTVTLSDVTANEGDGTATITASVDNPPQTDLVLTLSTGDTLTILAGETTGSVDVAINNDDDVYLDGSSFDVSVTGSTGGNFEDLDTSYTATVTVDDTLDTTTVTLSDVTANEGDGTATITASVDNPPQTDLVLTLSTGDTLTILAGETTGSVDVAINNDDDVYLDGSSFDVSVTGSTGGNFEDLDTSDTATVTVDDTLDTTTVTLSDVTANEGDGTATITASVDNPPQTDLVLTLSTGDTLTILAGETTGSVDVAINNDDDVYLDGSSFDVSVTGSTGGNFEDLDTSDTATVTVDDTLDTTTVTLSDVTANEGDGTATITASVDNPPQTDLVLTLSTGDTLTILAGETTGSVDVAINNDDDVYLDGSSFDVSVTGSSGGNFEDLDTSDTATVTVDDTLDTTTVTLSDVTANEGDGTATITASVDNPPQTDLVLTLSTGDTLTILAGETTGSVDVAINNDDDVYLDGSSFDVSVTGSTGGNFENLDTSDTATVTVQDTSDTTTVTLSDVTANEGDGTATITASVDNPPQTDLVLTLSTGDTLTILAGETTGSVDVAINNDDDVYLDGSSFDVSVTGSSGGNFEDLDTSDTATVTVDDTLDTTTVTLSDVTANEGDGTATITASVDNPPQTDLVLTLSTGDTLTILAGETTGSVDVAINNDDDVYLDGSSFDVSVTGSSGGNFEDLDTSDTATVTVQDTNDTTTVTLSDVTANEGDGTATITASVDNPPQTDLVLTLSTGDTLTILAGETTGSVDVAINNDDDVYLDGSSFDVSVTGSSGGNFEDLDTSDTATVTVQDTNDTTTVTLSDVTANEGDGTATITASVDNPPQTDLVLTLSTGDTLTILAGETTGSVDVAINNDDDVYVDGSSFDVSVTGSSGGNFEDLDTSDTATVTVQDTNDTTTVTLSDVTANEGDGTATITASVDNPPQTDLVLALSTGDTLTILAGETTGSVDVAINNDDDVYLDGSSFDVSVTGSSGGNFEDLDTSDTATVTVQDTNDTTTVTLSDVTANEGDGTATITASVDNPPQTDLVLTLSTGDTLTILAGETTGSVDVAINNDDDVYLDGSSFDVSVTGSTGGNFEDLDTSDTATVTVNDTIDTTTVTLDSATNGDPIVEGEAIIYTVTVDAPVTGTPLLVTLSNGISITIPVGQSSADSAPVTVTDADTPASLDVVISNASGGNYEHLTSTGNVTNTVDYTPDSEEDSAVVREGTVFSQSVSVLDNDIDKDAAPGSMTVTKLASDQAGSNTQSVNGMVAFTTALGGSVVMQADGTYQYTAPILDHETSDSIDDYFYYVASDGSSEGVWTKVTIEVTDSIPTALDDSAMVDPGSTVAGNILSNDLNNTSTQSDLDPSEVLTVTHEGVTKSFDNPSDLDGSGRIVFDTEYGEILISADGEYLYQSDADSLTYAVDMSHAVFTRVTDDPANSNAYLTYEGVTLYGFSAGDSFTDVDGKLLGLDQRTEDTAATSVGVGVGDNNQSPIENSAGNVEALVIQFDQSVSSISLDLINAADGDQFTWFAYDADGVLVDSGGRADCIIVTDGTNINVVPDVDQSFSSFVLSVDGADIGGQFRLGDFSYSLAPELTEEHFDYTMKDGDGDESSATLTVEHEGSVDQLPRSPDPANGNADLTANILVNGSFEDDQFPYGESFDVPLTGWSWSGSVEVWHPDTSIYDFHVPHGNQLIEIDSYWEVDGLSQSVNTVAGETYEISLETIVRDYGGAKRPGSSQFEIKWEGVTVALVTNDPAATAPAGVEIIQITPDNWQKITVEVTATGDSSELILIETGITGDTSGALIDNVKVIGKVAVENIFEGTPGNDILTGTDDDDLFFAGRGDDVMTGGRGNDGFVFMQSDLDGGTDTITDFKLGRDVLQLGDILDGSSDLELYLKVEASGGDTLISIDADGLGDFSGGGEQQIILSGVDGLGGSSSEMLQTLLDSDAINGGS